MTSIRSEIESYGATATGDTSNFGKYLAFIAGAVVGTEMSTRVIGPSSHFKTPEGALGATLLVAIAGGLATGAIYDKAMGS